MMQIKECIQETLNPLGVMVVVEAKHMCMQMRGVEKQNSITTTSDFTDVYKRQGLRLAGMKMMQLTDELLSEHYAHLSGKSFLQRVKESMTVSYTHLDVYKRQC